MKTPKVSIIIPTYNEEKNISDCISTLMSQSYKNNEIIIVDDGSTDKTREIISEFKKVRLIKGEHKGPGFSRNIGAEKAKGDILVFVDADMTFDKDYIKYLVQPILEGKSIGTEERYQKASNLDNIWSRCWGKYTNGDRTLVMSKGIVFRAILKSEFMRLGGFDPKYGYADDLTFYFKYGLRSDLADKALCYHKNPATLKAVFKQSKWVGASIQNKIIEIPILSYLVPPLMILFSPLAIIFLAFRKSYNLNDFSILIPWMLIFMAVRYFGTIYGLFRKIYLKANVR